MGQKLIKLIATGGGLGYAPFAPGTVGTAGALIISLLIMSLTNDPFCNYIHVALGITSYLLGVYVTNKLIPLWGDDPSKIVIDEYCGFWIAIAFTPMQWKYYLLAFALFRLFDITKILGISYFDRKKNAHGVMLDDVVAGVYTAVIINIVYNFGGTTINNF